MRFAVTDELRFRLDDAPSTFAVGADGRVTGHLLSEIEGESLRLEFDGRCVGNRHLVGAFVARRGGEVRHLRSRGSLLTAGGASLQGHTQDELKALLKDR